MSPRKPLDGVWPGVSVKSGSGSSSSSPQAGKAPAGKATVTGSIRNAMANFGWPTWRSIRGNAPIKRLSIRLRPASLTILQGQGLDENPDQILSEVRTESSHGVAVAAMELWDDTERDIVRLIFGSNAIELSGNNIDITLKICTKILRNEPYDPAEVDDERSPEYEKQREHLLKTLGRAATRNDVVKSRREIVQHTKAFNHISDYILSGGRWTEKLILDTHALLWDGLDVADVDPGRYRTHECGGRYGNQKKAIRFMRWKSIPGYMAAFVARLNKYIEAAEAGEDLDVYDIAAWIHYYFINIHPFADGNGRLVRILMGVFTLHYAGHVVILGESDAERESYLALTARASKKFHEEDMDVEPEDQIGHHELCDVLVRKSKGPLERMLHWAKARKNKRKT